MTLNFDFHAGASILFGPNKSGDIGKELAHLKLGGNRKIFIVVDPGLNSLGVLDPVKTALTKSGFEFTLYKDVENDPSGKSMDRAAAAVRKITPAAVIGIGGGSALDTAKFAAVLAALGASAKYFSLKETPIPQKYIPMIMIPTTAGTGAEVSRSVVFTDENNRKVRTWGDAFIAERIILDPALTVSLPKHVTAATGLDAMIHGIEAATGLHTNPFIQAFALRAVSLVSTYLETAVKKPDDMEARSCMLAASTLAGMAVDQAGIGIAHAFGHSLASLAPMPHGRAAAVSMDAVFELNAQKCPDNFVEIAKALGVMNCGAENNEKDEMSQTDMAVKGAVRFHDLVEKVGISLSLDDKGLNASHIDALMEALKAPENFCGLRNNCYMPTDEELREIGTTILTK